ncbi:hypothetical protein I3843_03G159600 [Carya illinoinensis]|nr:hypothetical protein I3843_03G159600 [Carya illinoinensis]
MQHLMVPNLPSTESMALAVNRPYLPYKPKNAQPPTCTHCHTTGHIAAKCYKLQGYPPGHKFHGKTKQYNSSANMASLEQEVEISDDKMTLTKDQYQKLLALLHPTEASIATHAVNNVQADCSHPSTMNGIFLSSHTNSPWLIDTGAIDHMICSASFFSSITSSVSFVVKLPNDQTAPISHIGTVYINSKLTLHNVLCVPPFHFNLISVKQLINSFSCCVLFLSQFCFI